MANSDRYRFMPGDCECCPDGSQPDPVLFPLCCPNGIPQTLHVEQFGSACELLPSIPVTYIGQVEVCAGGGAAHTWKGQHTYTAIGPACDWPTGFSLGLTYVYVQIACCVNPLPYDQVCGSIAQQSQAYANRFGGSGCLSTPYAGNSCRLGYDVCDPINLRLQYTSNGCVTGNYFLVTA